MLDHLEVDAAHLIGQSMGGWAVMGFALEHPQRVKSLVLADTIGGIYTNVVAAHFDGYIRRAGASPPPDALPVGHHPAIGEQLAANDLPRAFLYTQIASVAPPAPPTMGLQLRQSAYPVERVRTLDIPTLFIVGANDPIFPPAIVREAAEQIPGATVVEISATGHSPYFEAPEAWTAAVLDFLSAE